MCKRARITGRDYGVIYHVQPSYQTTWEADLGEIVEEEVWTKWSTMVHKGILNTSLAEANYKVLARWYLVPTRLAKFYPGTSPLCFRGCGQEEDMYHVWGSCPKVRRFWIRMFKLIYSVTGQNIPRGAKTGLFSDLPEEIPRHLRTLILHSFSG